MEAADSLLEEAKEMVHKNDSVPILDLQQQNLSLLAGIKPKRFRICQSEWGGRLSNDLSSELDGTTSKNSMFELEALWNRVKGLLQIWLITDSHLNQTKNFAQNKYG